MDIWLLIEALADPSKWAVSVNKDRELVIAPIADIEAQGLTVRG